ncbi:hypothetical protein [Burkholderia cepacia]|uniref:hypothetical protein n=1 Tax=Burkholderia cepacia TaxID=292 RepID=UPI00158CAA73|nr:hypothetical protein [Burkholderia cepacia]MCA7936668.1 hypothetical protein [Burkholderia cepacia]MDN7631811.1 hypothetical protein [Burkholderia cepacia]
MHHGDLQGKRIIFIVTINFFDGLAANPCRKGMGVDAFNRLTIGREAGQARKGACDGLRARASQPGKREGRAPRTRPAFQRTASAGAV